MIEQIEELNGQINVSGNIVGTIIGQNCSGGGGSGGGDMYKAVYDTNDNGIVDNAEKVNNHTVLSDVPQNAVFTDTTYTAGTGIDITGGVISNTQTSAEWGNISGNLSDQTDLKTALDSKANSSSIPTKTSDLTNDSKFKPITVDENFPSNPAKNDLCVQEHYNTVLESIGVGDNLNGVTLDLGFPEMGETPIMFEDPYTSSYNYNTEYPIIESNKYAVMFWHGNVTGFGYVEVIQLKNKDLNQTVAEFYWASETTIETTRQSYTLPDDFGTVTGIDNVIGVYPYIKKILEVYDYADYHYYDGSNWKKIGEKEIPISDTEPLDPEEDDLWIDTSDEAGGTNILSTIFPIGSIVIKADNVDYSNWLGFTWERTLIGRVAVGIDSNDTDFDTIGETGGSKELQAHRHAIAQKNDAGTGGYGSMTTLDIANIGWNDKYNAFSYGTSETGTGNSGNLQPYQVVAYWERVA